jgi:gliding motility-associated-like protein
LYPFFPEKLIPTRTTNNCRNKIRMMRNTFLLILIFTLFTGKLAAQCDLVINTPAAVCFPATVDLTATSVTAGSTSGMVFSYFTDAGATNVYSTPGAATAGTYYIQGDNGPGCSVISPVVVTVTTPPAASISYAGTPFCKALSTAQPVTLTGTGSFSGGNFTSTGGLTLNGGTGAITPSSSTAGNYVVTYTIPAFGVCPANPVTTSVTVVAIPTAPVVGAITQPTCYVSTGSVALSGLPSFSDWTVTVTPGGATSTGSGLTTTVNGLADGTTYTFKVTNYAGCQSAASGNATILSKPLIPSAPVVGTINAPTCTVATGSVTLNGLPVTGTWTIRRYPGGIPSTGTGTSTLITGLTTGTYNFSVTNSDGCVSASLSNDVVIPGQPPSPSAPVIGTIIHPTCLVAAGSVALSGLPAGTWTITASPGGLTDTGTGSTTTFTGLLSGTYTFTVAGSNGCASPASSSAVINAQPFTPTPPVIGTIVQPTCAVLTGSVPLSGLPSTGSWVLTRNPGAVTTAGSGTTFTVTGLDPGTYTFIVTNSSGCISSASANAVVNARPPFPGTPEFSTLCSTVNPGHAQLTITTPLGANLEYALDGVGYQSSPVFPSVANGNHFFAVRNLEGCTTLTGIFAISCGCLNPPVITLSETAGTTCGTTPVTVTGNTFGGSATNVTITENGAGTVTPSSSGVSPFSFTYTPGNGDRGRTVIITVTSDNPLGTPCSSAIVTYTLDVNPIPGAPTVGTITNLTCTVNTGSVVLNGLPATGTWTLTRLPDNDVTTGTSTSTTVTGLPAGTFNFTVTSEAGCTSVLSTDVVITPQPDSPTAPVVGTITNPTCATSTGSVVLSGLPPTGNYTLTRLPSGVTRIASGASYTVPNVPPGTYTYTVTNASGCASPPSASFVIADQPATPSAPSIGPITPPSCTVATGSVELFGLPATGTWTLTRYSGAIVTTGEGTIDTVTGIPTGTYNFTVANSSGCVSIPSANVVIPARPPTPATPVVGTPTQPTLQVPTGSVPLSGLPSSGSWVITRLPDEVTTAGTGTGITLVGLPGGAYTFTVTNATGCTSLPSAEVIISTPGPPDLIITDPPAACSPGKVDLTVPSVTEGSTTGLKLTYWLDIDTTMAYTTPKAADAGTYYIKGTTVSGYYDIKPVIATIDVQPVANAGSDQVLSLEYSTELAAVLGENETGEWSVESGAGIFADIHDPFTVISELKSGNNVLLWSVSNSGCPADTDKVVIIVGDIIIPTLITPNGDTKNEYFVIMGLESLGKTEIVIFDRRGAEVFKNSEYDNKWNGVDNNENPLPNDTYFYLITPRDRKALSGYIVIRR